MVDLGSEELGLGVESGRGNSQRIRFAFDWRMAWSLLGALCNSEKI